MDYLLIGVEVLCVVALVVAVPLFFYSLFKREKPRSDS